MLRSVDSTLVTTGTYIAATGVYLPPAVSVEQAVRDGLFDHKTFRRCQIESVCVADEESPPEMAAYAAELALHRYAGNPADIELILHANVYYQGREVWSPASYIQRRAVGNNCPVIEVRQMSNGGMAAWYLGSSCLAGRQDQACVLVTTGDKFCLPGFDRWNTDPGTVYADGGTAILLSNRDGFARLLALVMLSDSSLEQMHRGTEAFERAAIRFPQPINLETRKQQFIETVGLQYAIDRVDRGQDEVVHMALAEARVKLDDIDVFVLPAFGRRRLDLGLFGKFGIEPERSTWSFAQRIGHLGAGDQVAGLDHLICSGRVHPGQLCMLVGVGGGFSWSCAVVEIRETPTWNSSRTTNSGSRVGHHHKVDSTRVSGITNVPDARTGGSGPAPSRYAPP